MKRCSMSREKTTERESKLDYDDTWLNAHEEVVEIAGHVQAATPLDKPNFVGVLLTESVLKMTSICFRNLTLNIFLWPQSWRSDTDATS